MVEGHQGEFPRHLAAATERELAEATGLFDQSVDRLGDGFTPGIDRPLFRGMQLGPDGRAQRRLGPDPPAYPRLMVSFPPRGPVNVNLFSTQSPQVAFAAISCVRREPSGTPLPFRNSQAGQVLIRPRQHVTQPRTVRALGAHLLRHDDTAALFHQRMSVKSLYPTMGTPWELIVIRLSGPVKLLCSLGRGTALATFASTPAAPASHLSACFAARLIVDALVAPMGKRLARLRRRGLERYSFDVGIGRWWR